MQKRLLTMALVAITTISLLYSCTKLDTTVLGSDLLTVDNVNTFADTLEVVTTQGLFSAFTGPDYDSTMQAKTDIQYLGNITEPHFGKTEAAIYLQLKPTFFPYYFGNSGDIVKFNADAGLDSVVLCLSPRSIWGDSTISSMPQTIEVRAISDPLFKNKTDSFFGLRYKPMVTGSSLNFAPYQLTPQRLAMKTYFGKATAKDSITNQLRIRLDQTFANQLFLQDSTASNGFYNDSTFRAKFNGFEIKSTTTNGNTLYGFNLADGKTRLEFHYHKKSSTGVKDTVVNAFFMAPVADLFTGVKASSSVVNYLKRDTASYSFVRGVTNTNAYIQSAPGTYVNVKVPGLTAYRNLKDKIVHRAYLQIDQNDAPNTSKFTVPPFLYLDLKDSIIPNRFKPVYFDLNSQLLYNPDATAVNSVYHPYFANSSIEVGNFGGRAMDRVDGGVGFKRYELNLTRYVQHIVANNFYNYEMRVMAPYNYFYPQYLGFQSIIPFYNPLATGSVRVGAGTYPNNTAPRRMKFIVVYSKVK